MKRKVPPRKTVTVWQGHGTRWYQHRGAAYYSIAKELVLERYPRWLDDPQMDVRPGDGPETYGDEQAAVDGIANWRARRDRRLELFFTAPRSYAYDEEDAGGFSQEKWQRLIRRLAKFMMFVDDRRRDQLAALEQANAEFRRLYKRGPLDATELGVVDRRAAAILSETNDKKPGTLPARRTP